MATKLNIEFEAPKAPVPVNVRSVTVRRPERWEDAEIEVEELGPLGEMLLASRRFESVAAYQA